LFTSRVEFEFKSFRLSYGVLTVLFIGFSVIGGPITLSVCQLLNDVSLLPFHPLINITIIALVAMLVVLCICVGLKRNTVLVLRFGSVLAELVKGLAYGLVGLVLIAGIGILLTPLWEWLSNLPFWFFLLRALIVILWLVALWIFLTISAPLLRTLKQLLFPGLQKFPPSSFKSEDWKKRIQEEDAKGQEYLLLRTDHQTLSLPAVEFLAVLKEIRPLVKDEPALSTYWDQRYQLEEALKQERHG
jgi:hypothetical protein